MAVVQLTISALPAHVRTARLMATAVARRAGVSESTLDEIRLAVGEACSRAVEAHRTHCPDQPIAVKTPRSSVCRLKYGKAPDDPEVGLPPTQSKSSRSVIEI